jgi:AcrR family transcriptional regulator
MGRVSKGEDTRAAVLDEAMRMASTRGLRALTIGTLADRTGLSKSGLFAHFRSKEQLQLGVLERAADHYTDVVIRPALKAPRGEPRLRELFERSIRWSGGDLALPGGCIFTNLAAELDDEPPGPVRQRLVEAERDFLDTIATVFRSGVTEGHFRADVDPEQFAFDFKAVLLGYHHSRRLLDDPQAEAHARRMFEAIVRSARVA